MFDTVLIANRGEIAVRIIRTLRALGIRSVAVFSDADSQARHVREADVAVRLGPAPARESYLSVERLIDAATASRAQAVHPGYGFLAENAAFARACASAGLVFVGPSPDAIDTMGDKIRAKLAVSAAGVPVVPGRMALGMSDPELVAAAEEVGYPVLVKPSAGGGGKGMHAVHQPGQLLAAIVTARREAAASFGDDTLFLERLVARPRHIEVQILADGHGRAVHLGERECSLQRRHQKVIEEAPSPLLDPATRERIGAAAVQTGRSVGYTGAGTVEFIVAADAPGEFFFMEMNTRLQVEHPVTEMVTGIDLVEQQLRIAAGEHLELDQPGVRLTGHAIEARVYAEDPAAGFLPTGGRALTVREPSGAGIRVDSALVAGAEVGASYDPMLAKVVAWGQDRSTALARLRAALGATVVLGVGTNVAFLRRLLNQPDVIAGRLDTGLIERHLDTLAPREVPDGVYAAWAMHRLITLAPAGPVTDPWTVPDGWRIGGPAETVWRVADAAGAPLDVAVRGVPSAAEVRLGPGEPLTTRAHRHGEQLLVTVGAASHTVLAADDGATTWLSFDGEVHAVTALPPARRRAGALRPTDGEVRSPMPGSVVTVSIRPGDSVRRGDALLVVEAMKMEHTLTAPFDGVVDSIGVQAGQQVTVGYLLATVTASPQPEAAA